MANDKQETLKHMKAEMMRFMGNDATRMVCPGKYQYKLVNKQDPNIHWIYHVNVVVSSKPEDLKIEALEIQGIPQEQNKDYCLEIKYLG